MLRRYAAPGISFLAGAGWQLTGWESEPIGVAIMALALVWGIALLPPVRSLSLERGPRGEGIAIRLRPPRIFTKRRLRDDTFALVQQIRKYVDDQPSETGLGLREHAENACAMGAANDDDEQTRVWSEYTAKISERHERQRQELAARFGGQIRYTLDEGVRRGILSDSDASHIEWEAGSMHWVVDAANRLEAMARQL